MSTTSGAVFRATGALLICENAISVRRKQHKAAPISLERQLTLTAAVDLAPAERGASHLALAGPSLFAPALSPVRHAPPHPAVAIQRHVAAHRWLRRAGPGRAIPRQGLYAPAHILD